MINFYASAGSMQNIFFHCRENIETIPYSYFLTAPFPPRKSPEFHPAPP